MRAKKRRVELLDAGGPLPLALGEAHRVIGEREAGALELGGALALAGQCDPVGAVAGGEGQRLAVLGPERVEEFLDGRLGTAGVRPHQAARVLAEDQRHVGLAARSCNLVDPDAR